jgi:hypothetical protein
VPLKRKQGRTFRFVVGTTEGAKAVPFLFSGSMSVVEVEAQAADSRKEKKEVK